MLEAAMPDAAVHEDGHPPADEEDVGPRSPVWKAKEQVLPEPETEAVERRSHLPPGLSVTGASRERLVDGVWAARVSSWIRASER